jgi:hypothetical protein
MFASTIVDYAAQLLAIDKFMHMTRVVTEKSAAW